MLMNSANKPAASEEPNQFIKKVVDKQYPYGFVTAIESDTVPPGLDENIIRLISAKKKNLLLCWIGV